VAEWIGALTFTMSEKELGNRAGCHLRTVRRALKRIETDGFVQVQHRSGKMSTFSLTQDTMSGVPGHHVRGTEDTMSGVPGHHVRGLYNVHARVETRETNVKTRRDAADAAEPSPTPKHQSTGQHSTAGKQSDTHGGALASDPHSGLTSAETAPPLTATRGEKLRRPAAPDAALTEGFAEFKQFCKTAHEPIITFPPTTDATTEIEFDVQPRLAEYKRFREECTANGWDEHAVIKAADADREMTSRIMV
jgi:hypothetical protein